MNPRFCGSRLRRTFHRYPEESIAAVPGHVSRCYPVRGPGTSGVRGKTLPCFSERASTNQGGTAGTATRPSGDGLLFLESLLHPEQGRQVGQTFTTGSARQKEVREVIQEDGCSRSSLPAASAAGGVTARPGGAYPRHPSTAAALLVFGSVVLVLIFGLRLGAACCLASVATGTSFGTISTVGLALMGVGEAMGVPARLLAGAIVSGAYFGDKMSPLSDTTNVAPAVSGSNIYEHIGSMAYTALPALAVSLDGFLFLGTSLSPGTAQVPTGLLRAALLGTFSTGPARLVPIILLAVLSIKKVPPVPAFTGVLAVSFVMGLLTQKASPASLARAMVAGYTGGSGNAVMDKLLTRGGMNSMLPTVFLILMATGMGGVLRDAGVIRRLVRAVLVAVRSTRGLILSVAASCYLTLLATGNQMLALILPGQAFREAFAERHVPAKILSRTLEDCGTLGAPLVPWSTAALFINDMLKVPAAQYAPYALLNWITPLVAALYALTGVFTGGSSSPQQPRTLAETGGARLSAGSGGNKQ